MLHKQSTKERKDMALGETGNVAADAFDRNKDSRFSASYSALSRAVSSLPLFNFILTNSFTPEDLPSDIDLDAADLPKFDEGYEIHEYTRLFPLFLHKFDSLDSVHYQAFAVTSIFIVRKSDAPFPMPSALHVPVNMNSYLKSEHYNSVLSGEMYKKIGHFTTEPLAQQLSCSSDFIFSVYNVEKALEQAACFVNECSRAGCMTVDQFGGMRDLIYSNIPLGLEKNQEGIWVKKGVRAEESVMREQLHLVEVEKFSVMTSRFDNREAFTRTSLFTLRSHEFKAFCVRVNTEIKLSLNNLMIA